MDQSEMSESAECNCGGVWLRTDCKSRLDKSLKWVSCTGRGLTCRVRRKSCKYKALASDFEFDYSPRHYFSLFSALLPVLAAPGGRVERDPKVVIRTSRQLDKRQHFGDISGLSQNTCSGLWRYFKLNWCRKLKTMQSDWNLIKLQREVNCISGKSLLSPAHTKNSLKL